MAIVAVFCCSSFWYVPQKIKLSSYQHQLAPNAGVCWCLGTLARALASTNTTGHPLQQETKVRGFLKFADASTTRESVIKFGSNTSFVNLLPLAIDASTRLLLVVPYEVRLSEVSGCRQCRE